jgi:hypothetical protein
MAGINGAKHARNDVIEAVDLLGAATRKLEAIAVTFAVSNVPSVIHAVALLNAAGTAATAAADAAEEALYFFRSLPARAPTQESSLTAPRQASNARSSDVDRACATAVAFEKEQTACVEPSVKKQKRQWKEQAEQQAFGF